MKAKYFILFISIITLSCCKRDNGSPQVFTKASYPLAIGNWWQYQFIYCGGGGVTDTIMLSIVSATNSAPYVNYKCYYLNHGTVVDSGYFLQSDTSLSFTNFFPYPSLGCFPNFHLKFPVETGQHWQGAFPGDSIRVAGVADKCEGSYGTTFSPCFSTVESYNLPHNFMVNSMLLTPKIGLISQSIDYKSDTAGLQICQSVYLINYHVQ